MIKRILSFSNPAYLSLKLGQIVYEAKDDPEKNTTIPIEDVGVVILDGKQLTITSALMAALLENNCAIITCDDRHMPVGLNMPLSGNSLQNERFREQLDASEPLKKQMWQQTVRAKILSQAHVLDVEETENSNMLAWAKDVRSGDPDNLEGRAAAYYWKTVFHDSHFVRGQEGDPPNNLLNYGYAIIRALMARALVAAGLMPTLGIHHHNRYNAYCLADDIMEPYRHIVDLKVLDIMAQFDDISELTPAIKRELLSLSTKDVLIENHRSPMMIAMQTTANSVQKCFAGEARKIIYPDC